MIVIGRTGIALNATDPLTTEKNVRIEIAISYSVREQPSTTIEDVVCGVG